VNRRSVRSSDIRWTACRDVTMRISRSVCVCVCVYVCVCVCHHENVEVSSTVIVQ
jgi:hypothetical protein